MHLQLPRSGAASCAASIATSFAALAKPAQKYESNFLTVDRPPKVPPTAAKQNPLAADRPSWGRELGPLLRAAVGRGGGCPSDLAFFGRFSALEPLATLTPDLLAKPLLYATLSAHSKRLHCTDEVLIPTGAEIGAPKRHLETETRLLIKKNFWRFCNCGKLGTSCE